MIFRIFILIFLFFCLNFFVLKNFFYNFLWNYYFETWQIKKAEQFFQKTDNFIWKINMWNYYFLLWEREEEKQKKIDFYKKSLKIYLQIFENLKENDEKKENIGKNIQIIKSKIFQKNDEKIEENKEIKKDENKIFEEIRD